MNSNQLSRLRFNFGFLLEATLGTSRNIELDYPSVSLAGDLTLAPLRGGLLATRTSEGVYVNGTLQSAYQTECVRCLEPMQLAITISIAELFYYPPAAAPQSEHQAFIGDTGYIDLGPLVRELSLLEHPIQPICRADCQGLCVNCGQSLNEGDCGCEEDNIDPRLAALRKLLEE
ncbi:MAG: DUF177 domain-containing protein [Anaerolineae bacterium]